MSIKDKMMGSAKLIALSTELKSLETGTLRTLYSQLYLACETEGVDIKGLCPAELEAIRETSNKITDLNALKPDTAGEGIQAKALAAAETAQRKIKEQGLKSELQKNQESAGKKLYATFSQTPSPSVKAQELVEKINLGEKKKGELNAKIGNVSDGLPWYLKNPKHTAIGVAVILVLLFSTYKFLGWYNDPVRVSSRAIARSETDRQKKESDLNKKQIVEEQQAEAKRKKKEASEAKESNDAAARRLIIITNSFAHIDIQNRIILDERALKGFRIDLKGQKVKDILGMLNSTNYIGLIEVLNGVKYAAGDVPTMESITDAVDKLASFDFKLFVTTPGSFEISRFEGKPVMAIAFATDRNLSVEVIDRWQTDPDGRGFYADWEIKNGITVVTACQPEKLFERVRAIRIECANRQRDFEKKVELGEMNEEKIRPEIDRFLADQVNNLRKWLLEQ